MDNITPIRREYKFVLAANMDKNRERFQGLLIYNALIKGNIMNRYVMYKKEIDFDPYTIGHEFIDMISPIITAPITKSYPFADLTYCATRFSELGINDISHGYEFLVPITIESQYYYNSIHNSVCESISINIQDTELTLNFTYTATYEKIKKLKVYANVPGYDALEPKLEDLKKIITNFFITDITYSSRYKKKYGLTKHDSGFYTVYYTGIEPNLDTLKAGKKVKIKVREFDNATDWVGLTIGGIPNKIYKLISDPSTFTMTMPKTTKGHIIPLKNDAFTVYIREGMSDSTKDIKLGNRGNVINVDSASGCYFHRDYLYYDTKSCNVNVKEEINVRVSYTETRALSFMLKYAIDNFFMYRIHK